MSTYEESNNRGTLTLEGDLSLAQTEEFRMLLIKAIINVDELVIAFGKIRDVDLSCLQLLCSVHRSSIRMKKRVVFSGTWPKAFRKAVSDAGYSRTSGCNLDLSSSCLWVHE